MWRFPGCAALVAALFLSGCAGQFRTAYPAPLEAAVSRDWRVTEVEVAVPDSLVVNEANTLAPDGDIVWHGEPQGDRRAQVAAILAEGLRAGAAPLDGDRPVILRAQLRRFHGMTPVAIAEAPAGVHDISFLLWAVDARNGAVLAGPVPVDADLPARTRSAAIVDAVEGRGDRSRIVDHIAATTAGWLGIGPDPRGSFTSLGR